MMSKHTVIIFMLAFLFVKESVQKIVVGTDEIDKGCINYKIDQVFLYSTMECHQNITIEPKTKGTVRIAVVGDSTSMGVGGDRSIM